MNRIYRQFHRFRLRRLVELIVTIGTVCLVLAQLRGVFSPPWMVDRLSSTISVFSVKNKVPPIDPGAEWSAKSKSNVGSETISRDPAEYGIHVIGERHTGTSWLQHHLEECFGDQIKVYNRLSRHKYWFQIDDETKDYGLVVASFRNVYDWVQAMRKKPLHAPFHYHLGFNEPMNTQDFLTTPWIPNRFVFFLHFVMYYIGFVCLDPTNIESIPFPHLYFVSF